jgi:hypothetical protein
MELKIWNRWKKEIEKDGKRKQRDIERKWKN